jgi:hypothetical protein
MVTELPGFAAYLPAAVVELRRSTEELVEYFWDDFCRTHVCAQAAALAQAAKLEGHTQVYTVARAISSLCFIPLHEAIPIRHEVSDRLMELLELLGDAARASLEEQAG